MLDPLARALADLWDGIEKVADLSEQYSRGSYERDAELKERVKKLEARIEKLEVMNEQLPKPKAP